MEEVNHFLQEEFGGSQEGDDVNEERHEEEPRHFAPEDSEPSFGWNKGKERAEEIEVEKPPTKSEEPTKRGRRQLESLEKTNESLVRSHIFSFSSKSHLVTFFVTVAMQISSDSFLVCFCFSSPRC